MKSNLSPEQISDAEKLAKVLAAIPEDKRLIVTMMAMAFINGMEAQERLMAAG